MWKPVGSLLLQRKGLWLTTWKDKKSCNRKGVINSQLVWNICLTYYILTNNWCFLYKKVWEGRWNLLIKLMIHLLYANKFAYFFSTNLTCILLCIILSIIIKKYFAELRSVFKVYSATFTFLRQNITRWLFKCFA